ncbi:MAG: hypothetical protein SW833_08340 [Cyanobacteriota bacterium]|nr:hypothetical protein [Cyanobacteriota bacterium]
MWQTKAKIEKLSPEQEALIPVYREKWRSRALSTQPIDREKAAAAIQAVYREAYAAARQNGTPNETFGINPDPEILFFSSPNAVRLEFLSRSPQEVVQQLGQLSIGFGLLWPQFYQQSQQLRSFPPYETEELLEKELRSQLYRQLSHAPSTEQLLEAVKEHLALQLSAEERQRFEEIREHLRQTAPLQQAWMRSQEQWREDIRQQPGGDWLLQWGDAVWHQVAEPFWENVGQPLAEQIAQFPPIRQQVELFELLMPSMKQIMGLDFGIFYLMMQPGMNTNILSVEDFCVSVLNGSCDRQKWELLQSLASECSWYVPFSQVCLVCDRPTQLSFDSDNRLHAEGEPAIQFADGYCIYAHRGTILPRQL